MSKASSKPPLTQVELEALMWIMNTSCNLISKIPDKTERAHWFSHASSPAPPGAEPVRDMQFTARPRLLKSEPSMSRNKLQRPLPDGVYLAKCKHPNLISAAANGHAAIWPSARMVVTGDTATFYQGGAPVWACNVPYAALHFVNTVIPTGWFTDAANRAGTAHFFLLEGEAASSLCGRVVPADQLQGEAESLRQCSRCLKARTRG